MIVTSKQTRHMSRLIAILSALLGSVVAAYAFLDQRTTDAFVVIGVVGALLAVAAACRQSGLLFAARALAVAQGGVWVILLVHGGKGLVFGPAAWLAALIATRYPGIAAGILLVPVTWLVQSWAPILVDGASPGDLLIVTALVAPAAIAASVLLGQFVGGLSTERPWRRAGAER